MDIESIINALINTESTLTWIISHCQRAEDQARNAREEAGRAVKQIQFAVKALLAVRKANS